MRAVWWIAVRFVGGRIRRNPIRVALLIVALFLTTALWSSVLRVSQAGIRSFEDALGLSTDRFPVVVVPVGGRLFLEDLRSCFRSYSADVDVVAVRREVASVSSGGKQHVVRLLGVTSVGSSAQGREEDTSLQGTELLIAESLAKRLEVTEGDSLELAVGESFLAGTVVLGRQPSLAPATVPESVVVPLPAISGLLPRGSVDALYIRARSDNGFPALLADDTARWISSCTAGKVPLRVETNEQRIERAEALIAAYRFNVMIMAAMTLVVCGVLVCQATSMSLISVSRELSILRTLGVGRAATFLLVVGEGIVASVIAGGLGVTVGYPVTLYFTELLLGTAHEIYQVGLIDSSLSERVVSAASALGTVVLLGVVSSSLGALRALKVAPHVGTRRGSSLASPWSTYAVAVCVVVALLLVGIVGALLVSVPRLALAYGFIGVLLIAVAGTVPAVLLLMGRLRPSCLFPTAGRLAQGAIRYGGVRYLWGAVGAALSVALMVALSLMVESFRSTLEGWAATRLQGDLFVSSAISGAGPEARIRRELVEQLRLLPSVDSVVPYYETAVMIGSRSAKLAATDLRAQLARNAYSVVSGRVSASEVRVADGVLISEGAAHAFGKEVGERISVAGRAFVVQGVVREFGTEQPVIITDNEAFRTLYPSHDAQTITIHLASGVSSLDAQREVERTAGSGVIVRNYDGLMSLVRSMFNRTFRVTESVGWIVFVIAVLGLTTSTIQQIWERRREIKTLAVIGVSKRQLIGAIVLEALLVIGGVLVVGVVGGIAMGWCLTCYINPLAFGWTLHFSWSQQPALLAALYALVVAAVVYLAMSVVVPQLVKHTALSDE